MNLRSVAIGAGVENLRSALRAVSNPLLALRYARSPRQVVVQFLQEWNPEGTRLESEFKKSLYRFLKNKLPFVKITGQYGSGECDFLVGGEVMLELNSGFRSTQELQRLVGQIELYRREWQKPIAIVLLGESEKDLLLDLHSRLKSDEKVDAITKQAVVSLSPLASPRLNACQEFGNLAARLHAHTFLGGLDITNCLFEADGTLQTVFSTGRGRMLERALTPEERAYDLSAVKKQFETRNEWEAFVRGYRIGASEDAKELLAHVEAANLD